MIRDGQKESDRDSEIDLANPLLYTEEKQKEPGKDCEDDNMLQNMWPLVEEISKAVADESRDSEIRKHQQEHPNKASQPITGIYNDNHTYHNKGHKRIESLHVIAPSRKQFSGHHKSAKSQVPEFNPDFEFMKRHDKCKMDFSVNDGSIKKSLSKLELDSMISRLHKCGQLYDLNKKNRQTQMVHEIMSSLSFHPRISHKSKSIIKSMNTSKHSLGVSMEYLPIYHQQRLDSIESSKQSKLDKLKRELQHKEALKKHEEDLILHKVAEMTSASKYNHHAHMKKIGDYCKAYDRNKQEYQLQKQRQYSEMTFKPTVNKKSRHLANKTLKKLPNNKSDDPRKIKRMDKLRKDTEPTFRPRINKRSRLITSRAKQVKTRMLSPRRMANRDLKYVDSVDGSRNDEVICRLEYDIDESAHNLLRSLNLASDEKSYELRNMSDLVPARNTQNEYQMTSRDALNLFGAGDQEFQRQLMLTDQQQHLDLNDREDDGVAQQHLGNIPEESQDQPKRGV
ncbi:unnamed protein product [Moneuplotes crassus]|uniref:Uncharacterized protein n=1 Tax=Euplotes crassus TaxID=5936 RepID=A0AAD2DAM6_EUPCR|nr:unnamed protein product [Moneuplotes crassus]